MYYSKSKRVGLILLVNCFLYLSVIAQTSTLRKIDLISGNDVKAEVSLIQASSDQVSFCVKIPTISTSEIRINETKFSKVIIDGFSQITEPGKPSLPILGKLLVLPKDAELNIKISVSQFQEIDEIYIQPAIEPQPGRQKQEKRQIVIDESTYQTDKFYPSELAWSESVKIIRGIPITTLWISPIQFNPVQRKIKIFTEFTITIDFIGGSGKLLNQRVQSYEYDQILQNLTVNWSSISENIFTLKKSTVTDDELYLPGCDYLIISHSKFSQAADSLAFWRRLSGLHTKIAYIEDIGNSSESIADFIQTAYDSWSPAPLFVVFIGDAEYVPTNYRTDHPSDDIEEIGTDLYYATVDGDDYFPDLILGRISVDTEEEAMSFVQKVINYERTPIDDPEFYQRANVVAYFQDNDDEDTPEYNERDGYEDRRFVLTSEEVRNYLLSANYSVNRIYFAESAVTPTHYNDGSYANGEQLPEDLLRSKGFLWDGDAADISTAIEDGCFLVSHRDHGSRNGWGDPNYRSNHVRALNNGHKLPVVFSINCNTGWFDNETDAASENTGANSESFVEFWLRNFNGGAIGVFGSTRVSYSGYNDALAKGCFDAIWPQFLNYSQGAQNEPIYLLGQVLNYGKLYMASRYSGSNRKVEYEEFHFFGDPATTIWTQSPSEFYVDIPDSCFYNQTEMRITVTESNAVTTLVQNNEILATTKSGDDGIANLTFHPISSNSPIQLCIKKPNFKPFISKLNVFSPKGICIICESAEIIDQDGNSDINIGESISWNLTIKNAGFVDANQLQLLLNCDDEFITLIDSTAVIDILNIGEAFTLTDLSFNVYNKCPDDHKVKMELSISVLPDYRLSIPLDFVVKNGAALLSVSPSMIATSVTSLGDSSEEVLQMTNNGFGELQFKLKDETTEIITIGDGGSQQFYNSPDGAGNIYYFDQQANLLQFSSFLQVNSPITLYFFIYEGDQQKGIYHKISQSSSYVDQLGERLYWSDFLNAKIQTNKYYYFGVSWTGGDAKIGRAPEMPPYETTLGYIKTGTIKLGGNPPSDSVNQTVNKIFAFVQQLKIGEGLWFKCEPLDRSLFPLESTEIPLKFYATHQDTTFFTNILIRTNDSQHDSVFVPVHFMVDDTDIKLIWQANQPDDSKGNNNNEINLAEKISLPLTIKNIGLGTANNVVAQLSSPDSNILLCDSIKTIGSIASGEQISVSAFEFEFSPYCSSGHMANYEVVLSADNNILEKLQLSCVVKEGNPIIEVQPDSLTGTITQLNDSLFSQIKIKNNGFGRLFYNIENPIQEKFSIGSVAEKMWVTLDQGLGNVFHQLKDAHLLKVNFYLQIESACTLYFFVYEGNKSKGDYELIAKKCVVIKEPGIGWYSSGALECDLLSPKYYYIGMSWAGNVKVCRASERTPFRTKINEISTSAYNLGGYPPADSVYQKNHTSVIIAQQLITGEGLWLDLPTDPDNLYPKESRTLPVTFCGTSLDTIFFTKIHIKSNDSKNETLYFPTKLTVSDPFSVVEVTEVTLPNSLVLYQNYPNPIPVSNGNPSTEIRYAISKNSEVTLNIYNILGQNLMELIHKKQAPGFYQLTWNGNDNRGNPLASGIYFMILKAGNEISVRKVLLLK